MQSGDRILTTLLHNGLIPDPLYGLNNEQIPDIGDVGREYYTFWFYNTFQLPHAVIQSVHINFNCFRVTVWNT